MKFIFEIAERFSKTQVLPGRFSFQYGSKEYPINSISTDHIYYSNNHRLSDNSFKIKDVRITRKILGLKVLFVIVDS